MIWGIFDYQARQSMFGLWSTTSIYGFCISSPFPVSHLSQQVTVEDLEHLVEAKLAESLHGVADEGGGPALGQASDTILFHRDRKAFPNALVLVWVDLEG